MSVECVNRLCKMARLATLGVVLLQLTGCASFGRGVTEALIGANKERPDERLCHVKGHAFRGLESFLDRQEEVRAETGQHTVLKLMMVHGIGSHRPGYSTRLAENLARALGLTVTKERMKEFHLRSSRFPGEDLGVLRVSRYFNSEQTRDMFFYELTWDPIVEEEKQTIAYDNSGEYSFRRAQVNNMLKKFVNDTVPDVMTYQGSSRTRIKTAAAQAICWMATKKWGSLPESGEDVCNPHTTELPLFRDDDYVFLSHSLGSRIVLDSFHRLADIVHSPESQWPPEIAEAFTSKRYQFFMLSNQLPLLQLGRERPEVTEQFDEYCTDGGAKQDERWSRGSKIVAFSDPNDVMSYAIPPRFVDKYMDSRICPTMTNVIINIAHVRSLLGMGEFANPLGAHTRYDTDERVIGLIVRGLGTGKEDPVVEERCDWMEVR